MDKDNRRSDIRSSNDKRIDGLTAAKLFFGWLLLLLLLLLLLWRLLSLSPAFNFVGELVLLLKVVKVSKEGSEKDFFGVPD